MSRYNQFPALVAGLLVSFTPLFADSSADRLNDAADVLQASMDAPDKGIPRDLLGKANCVVIVPGVKKAAFIVGGKYGRGFMVCRKDGGGWGSPAAVRMEGGSFGFQIGASETDVVMLVMDATGKKALLRSKFTLGGDVSVAGGPVGRTSSAETDGQMKAKILSYSRARGAFAGLALNGATLRQDLDVNQELYGKQLTNRQVIEQNPKPHADAAKLVADLDKLSGHEH